MTATALKGVAPRRVDEGSVLNRWTAVWVTIGLIVVVVVIAFLVGIVGALESIDSALGVADHAVSGAGGDVVPLPNHISNVNGTLGDIDTALKPIPAQADSIIANLTTINASLGTVDGSLKDTSGTLVKTSGSLVDTSGSLVDTSGSLVATSGMLKAIAPSLVDTGNVLGQVLDRVTNIELTLEDAQNPGDKLGSAGIIDRLKVANGLLQPAKDDTGNILFGLKNVNGSLANICTKLGTGQCK
jgi:hypothetical protein